MTQLIIVQAIQNVTETFYPFAKRQFCCMAESLNKKKVSKDVCTLILKVNMNKILWNLIFQSKDFYEDLNIPVLSHTHLKVVQNQFERNLEEYDSTYEDYLELYIQFGYVVLFSSVAPLAAFWALLNNIIEIPVDAFKVFYSNQIILLFKLNHLISIQLCKMYKRPFARRAKDTGAWLLSFQMLSIMSIVTNCGIMLLLPQIK